MTTDALDEQIIDILSVNGRLSNREVARTLKVSEGTVRNRLKRLEQSGVVRLGAVVEPKALGLKCSAFVRLETTPAAARSVANAAAALDEVPFVALMTGRFDVVAMVLTDTREALAAVIHNHFNQWKGVIAVETLEIVRVAQHRLDVIRVQPSA